MERICSRPTITATELAADDALRVPEGWRKTTRVSQGLFDATDADPG